MIAIPQALRNPYVGPRPFQTGEQLYGRDRETRDLLGLLIAERIVLLIAPAGAGTTSLIQASLIPRLRDREFHVLPIIRLSATASAGEAAPAANRYVLSTLCALEAGRSADDRLPLADLAALSLNAYLDRLPPCPATDGEVLIFDQFEELLTIDPADHAGQRDFVQQLGVALRHRGRWALLAIREKNEAALAPLLRMIPTRCATTFRLGLLSPRAARAAIQQPAHAMGVTFSEEAVNWLLNDLSREQEQLPGSASVAPGPLQVACFQLWERLQRDRGWEMADRAWAGAPGGWPADDDAWAITLADVQRLGDGGDDECDLVTIGAASRAARTWM